ncbi:flagellar basal body P-ring protein FlgI [Planctomicrobium sp. SH664]|uniref:flagellar basal body P-ring protein FlgI n=1 Tax=Planctomicrobium sp. SH664 TaxID=3448125 RepID=UPI003F5B3EEE
MQARRLSLFLFLFAGLLHGCHELNLVSKFEKKEDVLKKKVRGALQGENGHSRLIGDYIKIADSTLGAIKIQGVAMVSRLNGTGEDPPASPLRAKLLEDMRKKGVKDPNKELRSADTALVIVTAWVPPIVRKGDKLDVEVTLPEGSESTSLAGGWLMPCHLQEHALIDGSVHEGREIAIATGPILVDSLGNDSKASETQGRRRGRIPAGATYNSDDRNLTIAIRSDYATVRMSSEIANRIGRRFHDYDDYGIQRPLAKAKTDSTIELVVADRYRDNYQRYLQCIRHMRLKETPVERHIRLQELAEQIQFGPTAEKASLQLEAIGPEAIPTLKTGLTSPDLEARFHAGMALAYLGNTDGVPALKESAEKEPAFRIFALAALAALEDGAAGVALRDLMNVDSVETRYGAFRAFSTMSPNDPVVQGVEMPGNFTLHPIESTGIPLVHITRHKKAEIVVFGDEQEFQMPMVARAGSRILVQGNPRTKMVTLRRIAANEPEQSRTVSANVLQVIRAATELGATYPDIVELLVQAQQSRNLQGQVAIDALPRPGRTYTRPARTEAADSGSGEAATGESVQIGGSAMTPNMFEGRQTEEEEVATPNETPPLKSFLETKEPKKKGSAKNPESESADAGWTPPAGLSEDPAPSTEEPPPQPVETAAEAGRVEFTPSLE